MNLGEMRTWIRTYLDLDVEDLSDLILDQFLNDGAERILDMDANWPWLQHTWQITLGAEVGTYVLSSLTPEMVDLTSVAIDGQPLVWRDYAAVAPSITDTTQTYSTPQVFTAYAGTLYVLPAPSAITVVDLAGTREPTRVWATSAGAEPDMPAQFHRLLLTYGLAQVYAQQDDPEMAAFHEGKFDRDLGRLHKRTMRSLSAPPIVLNGGHSTSRVERMLPSDWWL